MSSPIPEDATVLDLLPIVAAWPDDMASEDQASAAGLKLVADDEPGLTRVRRGRGFSYHRPTGALVRGGPRERLQSLAIPPAWTDVWICRDASGHVQVTGRDDAGRKQYLYHPVWRQLQEAVKFQRLTRFVKVLPAIREAVDQGLGLRPLSQDKVIAWIVALLDQTCVRIGDEHYAQIHGSIGLTTLDAEHVEVEGAMIRLCFPGKSGVEQRVELRDERLARQLQRADDSPGDRLFTWCNDDDTWSTATAIDVNEWLADLVDGRVTTKDFRTWGATVEAVAQLHATEPPSDDRDADAKILAAIDAVAERLGNTRAIARASYVHPLVPLVWRDGRLDDLYDPDEGEVDWLSGPERALARLLADGA